MSEVEEAAHCFLCEQPVLGESLQAVLEVDTEQNKRTLTDLPIGSEAFEEQGSWGIIGTVNSEYQVIEWKVV